VRITAFSKTISGGGALVPTCCSCPAMNNLYKLITKEQAK